MLGDTAGDKSHNGKQSESWRRKRKKWGRIAGDKAGDKGRRQSGRQAGRHSGGHKGGYKVEDKSLKHVGNKARPT